MAIDDYDFCGETDYMRVMVVFGIVAMAVVIFLLWTAVSTSQGCAPFYERCVEAINASGMCDYPSMEEALYWGWGHCTKFRNATASNGTIDIPRERLWRP